MGELTGEDWYVEFWLRQGAPRTGSAADRVHRPPTLAQREAEAVWHFARCDLDTLELTSLENRLYYGPTGSVQGFVQHGPDRPVQFDMELYGEHHAAMFSLHDGRLDVLNQLPEREPLDSFVRQLNESLERNGRRLAEVSEFAGTLRLVKAAPPAPDPSPRRRGRRIVAVTALVGAATLVTAIIAWLWPSGGDDATDPSAPRGPLQVELVTNRAVDCRVGTPRRDVAIEVQDVTVVEIGATTVVTVSFGGAPFDRFAATVGLVVPDDPVEQVDATRALSYLFLPGPRWTYETYAGVTTSRAIRNGPAATSTVAVAAADIRVVTDEQGYQSVRFAISDFPAVVTGTVTTALIVTSGIATDNRGAGPETCAVSLVRLTR
jgi:hypothetical protein